MTEHYSHFALEDFRDVSEGTGAATRSREAEQMSTPDNGEQVDAILHKIGRPPVARMTEEQREELRTALGLPTRKQQLTARLKALRDQVASAPKVRRFELSDKERAALDWLKRGGLVELIDQKAAAAAQKRIESSPAYQRGSKSYVGAVRGRAEQKRKREIGRKADEGKVRKAQTEIDRVNAATQLWASGNRTRTVRDQLIFRGARVLDDETVRITRNGMIDHIARVAAVPARTLYDWVKAGHLTGVPPAKSK